MRLKSMGGGRSLPKELTPMRDGASAVELSLPLTCLMSVVNCEM